jgi:hypothetical protein
MDCYKLLICVLKRVIERWIEGEEEEEEEIKCFK